MTDGNEQECFPDPEGMSEDEKVALIHTLHAAHHNDMAEAEYLFNAVSGLSYAMHSMAADCIEGNVKGERQKTLYMVAAKLEALAMTGFGSIGITAEQVEEAEKFADIVEGLDLEMPGEDEQEETQ